MQTTNYLVCPVLLLWMLALSKYITHSIVYLPQQLIYRALNLHKNVLFCLSYHTNIFFHLNSPFSYILLANNLFSNPVTLIISIMFINKIKQYARLDWSIKTDVSKLFHQ